MSVTELAKFIHARTPAVQQKIIEDQRKPRAFKVAHYQLISGAAQRFLLSAGTEPEHLEKAARRLRAPSASSTKWKADRSKNCLEALERLQRVVSLVRFGGERSPTGVKEGTILISGLPVSIHPEIVLMDGHGARAARGAIKLHFNKKPLTAEAGATVAVALALYLRTLYPGMPISAGLCQVIDVFTGRVFKAPQIDRAYRRAIFEACKAIRAQWDDPPRAAA